jgi:cytoskeletal protein RodZ
MGTGNLPPSDKPDYRDGPGEFDAPDHLDETVETPSIRGEPTQMIPVVPGQAGGPSGPGGSGPGPGPDADDNRRRNLVLIVAGVFVVGIAIGGLIVWLTHSDSSTSSSSTTDSSSSTSSSSSSSSSTSTTESTTTTEPETTTTGAPAVQITSFQATSSTPNCTTPASDVSTSVPATVQQVTLSWTTEFSTSVDISVDGPGVFQSNVGPSGSIMIPYGCAGPHVYLLTAHGANGSANTKSVTISSTH